MTETPRKTLKDFGTLERLQEQLQECKTIEELAVGLRDVGLLASWVKQLLEYAVREVLFYEEAREKPGMALYQTEARLKEAMVASMLPLASERAVLGKLAYDQARAITAAIESLSGTSWAVTAASKALGAQD